MWILWQSRKSQCMRTRRFRARLAFCTAHSMSFGEFTPRTGPGRAVVCVTAFVGPQARRRRVCVRLLAFAPPSGPTALPPAQLLAVPPGDGAAGAWGWTQVCLASIVLLAHVPGDSDRFRSAAAVFVQMVRSAWASFLVLFVLIIVIGLGLGNELLDSDERSGPSAADGVYLAFLVAHKISFGEVLVGSVAGRTAVAILEQASLLHVVLVLSLVGLRRRTGPEHQALLTALNQDPRDTTFLGDGYVLLPVEPEEDTADIELHVRGASNAEEEGVGGGVYSYSSDTAAGPRAKQDTGRRLSLEHVLQSL